MVVKAIFKDGALHPVEPISLQEGAEVEFEILRPRAFDPAVAIELVERAAAMPPGDTIRFDPADHDTEIYEADPD